MSSVPALVRRFRARELAKIIPNASAERLPDNPTLRLQNPFLPWFDPETKRWAPPLYSRRRQAELIKAAKKSGTLHLMPPGPKMGVVELGRYKNLASTSRSVRAEQSSTFDSSNAGVASSLAFGQSYGSLPNGVDVEGGVEWMGAVKERAVPGADIGARLYAGKKRMFKGHKWERQLRKRRGQIAVRMRDMAKRIQRFKSVSRVPFILL